MAIAPIWKDYFVTLGTGYVIPFRIRVQDQSGDIIYNGKSHIKPGGTDNSIRINDIDKHKGLMEFKEEKLQRCNRLKNDILNHINRLNIEFNK